jgi:Arc/MetJ-type ribon-helix-helix transcriptional regulator
VQQVSVTLTLPKGLYDQSLRLVEKGIFTSFEEMVQSGLRKALIEGLLLVEADEVPSGLSGGERSPLLREAGEPTESLSNLDL